MARIDDYKNAKEIALKEIAHKTVQDLSQSSQFENIDDTSLRFCFLDQTYTLNLTDGEFKNETTPESEVPLQEQVLILHYLKSAHKADKPTDKYIAYREIDGASFYFGAFAKRAINPLKSVFGSNLQGFKAAGEYLKAMPLSQGDAAFTFTVFPKMPIQLILWEKDEEFDSEANILFDSVVSQLFSAEDAAWLASMVVYRLMSRLKR